MVAAAQKGKMRNCPVCGYAASFTAIEDYLAEYVRPLFPSGLSLRHCKVCGHHYVDGPELNQDWLNQYYAKKDTSPDLHDEDAHVRMLSIAERINGAHRIADIGGLYAELQAMVPGVHPVGAGMRLDGLYDFVVISHCLEHVYDMSSFMLNVTRHLNGRILIEVPRWDNYDDLSYDHWWFHVNKFRPQDLERLLTGYGFRNVRGENRPDLQDWKCYRIEGEI